MSHVSDTLSPSPTPLEELFNGDKADFKSCVLPDWKFKFSVRSAVRQKVPESAAECTIDRFFNLLKAKPYPARVTEILNEAAKACK